MIRRLTPAWRLRATAAALLFPPLVQLIPLDALSRWINRRRAPRAPDPTVDDLAIAEWVDRVLLRLPPPWKRTCLRRAIALHYLLRRAGRPADLMIGVKRDDRQQLAAHAWLARDGSPCLEEGTDPVSAYQVLTTFPSLPGRS